MRQGGIVLWGRVLHFSAEIKTKNKNGVGTSLRVRTFLYKHVWSNINTLLMVGRCLKSRFILNWSENGAKTVKLGGLRWTWKTVQHLLTVRRLQVQTQLRPFCVALACSPCACISYGFSADQKTWVWGETANLWPYSECEWFYLCVALCLPASRPISAGDQLPINLHDKVCEGNGWMVILVSGLFVREGLKQELKRTVLVIRWSFLPILHFLTVLNHFNLF